MQASRSIRSSLEAVFALRQSVSTDPALRQAVAEVKRLQARRFSGTYADLLQDPRFAAAAQFFLRQLYGDKDYTERDQQFARIAAAIEKLFPAQIAETAAALARVHALTEDLDVQMARFWLAQPADADEAQRYVAAWRALGRSDDRAEQLASVIALGRDLTRLTRMPGLRTMLRMMRRPASAAGLESLQGFLEAGFDTFAGMARTRGAVEQFLDTVRHREEVLMALLSNEDAAPAQAELRRILGQAP